MSILYCLLFLFCLSLHACNARPLVAIDKKDEKKGTGHKLPVLPAKEKSPLSNDQVGALSRGDSINETRLADKQKKSNEKTSGSHQTESLVSVSWQVPRNKRVAKHPGFNSDYSPPKTHPPSHN
ncbi:hypothetical protein ACOSP7_001218 [Xanthoceras sorbifolium]|uniref:Uncharacterized protein n=1 Tax=Xanthoceras sorbifolium TaxID=99658 RepID=A0ABQ8IM23_9ROSI|nr:hypothetical protein JRO89_XS01G0295700 [Xanthoceras sorbifolium]